MTVSADSPRRSSGRDFLEGMVGIAVILFAGAFFFTDLLSPTPYAGQTVGKHWTVPAEARGFGCRSWADAQEVVRETTIGRDGAIRLLARKAESGACVLLKTGDAVLITETGSDRFRFRTSASGFNEFWAPKTP